MSQESKKKGSATSGNAAERPRGGSTEGTRDDGDTVEKELPKLIAENEFLTTDSRPQIEIPQGKIIVDPFGFYKKLDPEEICPDIPQVAAEDIVRRYTLVNHNGIAVQVMNYGATITSILLPDREGNLVDVVLGFDDITDYVCQKETRMGSTIGRYAGVISEAEFKIGNKDYYLSSNYCNHHRHGGCIGFDSVLWDSFVRRDHVVMTYSSRSGEEGYPGQLMVQVSFRLTGDDCLVVETSAKSSLPTPVSIAHQPYFNLAGHAAGPDGLKEHCIMVNADRFVITDELTEKPTGELKNVGGTYYDLRIPRPLGKGIERAPGGLGYDLTYFLTKGAMKTSVTFGARLLHPDSGRYVEVLSDQPGLYMYTCGDFPNPDLPPPPSKALPGFFVQEPTQDDDGLDIETKKYMDKANWPRPPSMPSEEHVFPEGSNQQVNEDERCETPPPGSRDLSDQDFVFPRKEILDTDGDVCHDPELSDEARSDHEEMEGETEEWCPPQPIEGKGGALYRNGCAIILMPMELPDSIKHRNFPNPILYPGEVYSRTVIYKFGVSPKRQPEVLPDEMMEMIASLRSGEADGEGQERPVRGSHQSYESH